MKKKRLTLLSLALALCLSLSACAGKDARVVSNAGAEEKKTEISLLTTANNTTAYNALNSAIAVFEDRRPDVRVVFEGYNTGAILPRHMLVFAMHILANSMKP